MREGEWEEGEGVSGDRRGVYTIKDVEMGDRGRKFLCKSDVEIIVECQVDERGW